MFFVLLVKNVLTSITKNQDKLISITKGVRVFMDENSVLLAIVYSLNDPAGKGMAEKLKPLLSSIGSEKICLKGFEESVLEFDFLEKRIPADFYLVLSKHKSEKAIPSLTVHHTGNLRKNALM
jgi:D-tyrosyl-tRNA(Tyr) deacylase